MVSFSQSARVLLLSGTAVALHVRQALTAAKLDCIIHVMKDNKQGLFFINDPSNDLLSQPLSLALIDMRLSGEGIEDVLVALRQDKAAQTPAIILTEPSTPSDEYLLQRFAPLHFFLKPSSFNEYTQLAFLVWAISMQYEKRRRMEEKLSHDIMTGSYT